MLLRKFLVNARFLGAEQLGADRVLTLRFEGLDELGDLTERRLVIEIMGRHSNMILVGPNGRIVDSARPRHRGHQPRARGPARPAL